MCTACKNVKFTLMLSAGMLVWLYTLFSLGAMLLR